MQTCDQCGMRNPDDALKCKRCGFQLPAANPPPPVEKLVLRGMLVSTEGYFMRVVNAGTAPMVVDRVTISGRPTPILGVASGKGIFKDGLVTVPPGDESLVHIQLPPDLQLVGRRLFGVHTVAGSEESFELTLG